MLIKLAKSPYFEFSDENSFILFDKVDQIQHFRTQPIELDSNEKLNSHVRIAGIFADPAPEVHISEYNDDVISQYLGYGSHTVSDVPRLELTPKKVFRYNAVQFMRLGVSYYLTFDTICYICNDEGKTLEKCFAGGILNK